MPNIHRTAIVSEHARVDPSAKIGPYSIVDHGAIIGPDCVIDSHVRIYSPVRMGSGNRVFHGALLGSEPQDIGYRVENAKLLTIGDNNHFREYVNISGGLKETQGTVIGNGNYLMNGSHVGHDCVLGDHNILVSNAAVGGHVKIEHHVFLSGQVAVHQFCRIGAYVMVGGVSGVRQDVPPYCMVNGQYARYVGINMVGLKRNGFDQKLRSTIKRAYQKLFNSNLKRNEALRQIRSAASTEQEQAIIEFVEQTKRGLVSA